MAVKEIYDKDHERVQALTKQAHIDFIRELADARNDADMKVSDMTNAVGAGPAMTYRVLDPNENITLNSMERYAASVGKKVSITLEDLD